MGQTDVRTVGRRTVTYTRLLKLCGDCGQRDERLSYSCKQTKRTGELVLQRRLSCNLVNVYSYTQRRKKGNVSATSCPAADCDVLSAHLQHSSMKLIHRLSSILHEVASIRIMLLTY